MSLSAFVGPLAWALGPGTAVAATASQTSLLTGSAANGKWSMPGNFLALPGQQLRMRANGIVSTPAATAGNLSFQFYNASVIMAASGSLGTSQVSQTNIAWNIDWWFTLLTQGDGTLATFRHSGVITTALISATNQIIPITSVTGTGFNSSASAIVDLQVTWSNTTAGNTITLEQYVLESVV